MNNRKISWEIVATGLAFIGIAIFLFNPQDEGPDDFHFTRPPVDSISSSVSSLPSSIVTDLQNLDNFKKTSEAEKS